MYKHLSGRLEDLIAIGDTPVHLWAACQICDMKSLDGLAGFASLNAPEARRYRTNPGWPAVCCRGIAVTAGMLSPFLTATALVLLLSSLNPRQRVGQARSAYLTLS